MPRMPVIALAALALSDGAAGAARPTPAPRQINLLAEARTSTAASCSKVWSLLLARETWLGGFVSKRRLSGPIDRPGEVSFVHTVYQGRSNDRFEEVIVASPGQRYLLAMMVPEAGISTFSDYQLQPGSGGCDVHFSVKLTKLLGRGERRTDVDALRVGTQRKIEIDLLSLKRAAERR